MDQSRLRRRVLHPVGIVADEPEIGVLVNAHGDEALDLAQCLGANGRRVIRPDLGVGCSESSATLHSWKEDLADVGAVLS